jgi:hypothetical protein
VARPADIAELQQALERCCADLAAALAVAEVPAPAGPGAVVEDGGEAEAGGPRWQPLILAPIPGLDTLVDIVKPPLQVIVALLKVIAALLQALAAILIGLPDIFRALILAAYALLRDIINDLLNTGAYMYVDAPGITPTEVGLRETGIFLEPEADWKAGRTLQPAPVVPDGFTRWATRFAASFDDPGDLHRPVITEGAPIQAVFIVMAAPSLESLRQLIYLLGRLLNIDRFKVAFEQYDPKWEDPRRNRARRTRSVPPDWQSKRLRDVFPALEGLMVLPEALKSLLSAVDSLSALIRNLAAAIQEKANLLLQLAAAIQAIIDVLDALKSTGMYSLGVATQGGVAGLRQAFMTATNRPPGGYIGGVCFLASGPNLAKAAMLFDLLGGTTAIELAEGKISLEQAARQGAIGQAAAVLEGAGAPLGDAFDAFASTVTDESKAFVDAVASAPAGFYASVGQTREELVRAAGEMRALAVDAIAGAGALVPDLPHIEAGVAHTRQAQRFGARSLALGHGTREPDSLLRAPDEEPPEPDPGGGPP